MGTQKRWFVAAGLLGLVVSGGALARADEPAPAVIHVPVSSAPAGKPLLVAASLRDAHALESVSLRWRRLGEVEYRTVPFVRTGAGGSSSAWSATIPADACVAGGVLEYYLASGGRGAAAERLHFAAPGAPQRIVIEGDAESRARRAYLARHLGLRSRFSVQAEVVDFGNRTLSPDGEVRDWYWRLEGDYTYRILGPVYSLRLGVGLLRGATYDLVTGSTGDVERTPVARCAANPDGLCVGLTYGFAEVRFRPHRLVRFDVKAILGAGPEHFDGGGGLAVIVGNDPGTHVAVGGDVVSSVGLRGYLRLAWSTIPRVPMSLTLEVTSFPDFSDLAGRAYLSAEYRIARRLVVSASAGYGTRDFLIGGPSGGLGLALEF